MVTRLGKQKWRLKGGRGLGRGGQRAGGGEEITATTYCAPGSARHCSKRLYILTHSNLHDLTMRQALYLHFADEQTEAQRESVTCLGVQSYQVEELGFEPRESHASVGTGMVE